MLTDSLHDWISSTSEGISVDAFISVFPAFDRVIHCKLLLKIRYYVGNGSLLSWLENYLEDRYMTVKVRNTFSRGHKCLSDVPQGGASSPLLFLVYTIDVSVALKISPCISVQIFADDVKIYACYDKTTAASAHSALSRSIEAMYRWSQEHELPLNLGKTAVLRIGKPPFRDYILNGRPIDRKDRI